MKELIVDTKRVKSYVSKENLMKALDKLQLPENVSFLLYPFQDENGKDRYTAIFNNVRVIDGMYVGFLAHKGFMVIG